MARRILHIIDTLGSSHSAAQVVTLAPGLAAAGCEIHIAALDRCNPTYHKPCDAVLSTTELNRRWRFDPLAFNRLRKLIGTLRPEVIHAWNFEACAYSAAAARVAKVPSLVFGQYRIDAWAGSFRRMVTKRMPSARAKLVTNSHCIRSWWAKATDLPMDSTAVIPPAVRACAGSDTPREVLLRELEVPQDARLIGVVGRLVSEKRVKDLIWAADLLRVLHDNLRLLVIGDGPLRTQLQQYARLASDLDHVRFLGERADVGRLMPHFDVLWNASEGGSPSMPILEAMAAGVPVVASDIPINRELISDAVTGYLVPLLERSGRADRARHTDRLFNDRAQAEQITAAARQEVATRFSVDAATRKYIEFYESFP